MGTRRRPRQCPRCGRMNPAKERECVECFTPLVKAPFRMDKRRIRYVHALARQKGLDDELYRLRLQSVGVNSCKDLKRDSYNRFVREMRRLPDAR